MAFSSSQNSFYTQSNVFKFAEGDDLCQGDYYAANIPIVSKLQLIHTIKCPNILSPVIDQPANRETRLPTGSVAQCHLRRLYASSIRDDTMRILSYDCHRLAEKVNVKISVLATCFTTHVL